MNVFVLLVLGGRDTRNGSRATLKAELRPWNLNRCLPGKSGPRDAQAIKECEQRHQVLFFVYSFNKYVSSVSSVPGPVLETGIQQQVKQVPAFTELTF